MHIGSTSRRRARTARRAPRATPARIALLGTSITVGALLLRALHTRRAARVGGHAARALARWRETGGNVIAAEDEAR